MTLLDAHKKIISRYRELIEASNLLDREHWMNYCDTALSITNTDKLSRWVGFIQGLLYSRNMISIDTERDYTRNIYKPIYDSLGENSSTVSVVSNTPDEKELRLKDVDLWQKLNPMGEVKTIYDRGIPFWRCRTVKGTGAWEALPQIYPR